MVSGKVSSESGNSSIQCHTIIPCVLVFSQTNGAEMELKVRPGDNITLYSRSKSMVMGEASRGSPSLQEGVLKAGWLKKQRSIMKNWQLRWFVLRADHLYFYKDEEETKPQMRSDIYIETLTSVSYSQSLTKMERSRVALIVLMFLLFHQKRINGEEVEMKVRPGDNITLYCDRSLTYGSLIVWIRNCSHENQPSLIIDFTRWGLEIFQRFSSIYNRYSNSYDLHITNISVSDLGQYYCAEKENKVNKDEKGIISSSEVYYYGNRTTRLSLELTSCSEPSAPPDCVLCWMLLFSVCPVCVLLFSICLFCLCCKKTTDVITKRQKQHKTKRVQSSDFSTYAQLVKLGYQDQVIRLVVSGPQQPSQHLVICCLQPAAALLTL
ncbi:uncharacterized protein LOC107714194 [Sinocyclocheilus rhinocerous]|uniref:uncharacterized protein LOC107714194 n=1 Tax=Sinocyclocheilus rhinocerous TaxID=307959 RepID=UPI0007B8ABAF|nr:PREDICTED: uncharacterized protein LOC107714194 [Sinocyclocheilus rhinocerous]